MQECGITLRQVEGTFTVITSADWILEQLNGDVVIHLGPDASSGDIGRVNAEALALIRKRMKLCPVSRNLPHSVQKHIDLPLADTSQQPQQAPARIT